MADEVNKVGWYWKIYPGRPEMAPYIFYAYKSLDQLWEKESGLPVAGGSALYCGPLKMPSREASAEGCTCKEWIGLRVTIRDGWLKEHDCGTVLGQPVFAQQWWAPVKWDDANDPDFFKLAGLKSNSPFPELVHPASPAAPEGGEKCTCRINWKGEEYGEDTCPLPASPPKERRELGPEEVTDPEKGDYIEHLDGKRIVVSHKRSVSKYPLYGGKVYRPAPPRVQGEEPDLTIYPVDNPGVVAEKRAARERRTLDVLRMAEKAGNALLEGYLFHHKAEKHVHVVNMRAALDAIDKVLGESTNSPSSVQDKDKQA